ncbi:hypothetical protein POL68_31210 [Stigmatella sp. ncwal1]|uniref:Uncharacterized protein n=1 Tax=Stigmatella ashevillensis TaxID=2995309 RepID=A0ABT5DH27_9BACT|nr:hypothetical protein [Stigmatella ashevillena]MDC0712972.1 hypothetical protein [Stigmatella ashevillena]
MATDTNRRTIAARAVGRVLSGQDRYEKEALEGDPASPLAETVREQRRASLPAPQAKGSFADKLQQQVDAGKKRKP